MSAPISKRELQDALTEAVSEKYGGEVLFDVFVQRKLGSVRNSPKGQHRPTEVAMLMIERQCNESGEGGDYSFTLPNGEAWTLSVTVAAPPLS